MMPRMLRRWERGGKRIAALCLATVAAAMSTAAAGVTLPPVLGSHMVLQRGVAVPIWGTALPGEKVTVKFREQTVSAVADADGKWSVRLAPLQTGPPAALTVAGTNTLTLDDVLVGEVWLGSGQSNMDSRVSDYVTDTLAAAPPAERDRLLADPNRTPIHDAANKYHLRDETLTAQARETYPQVRLFTSGGGGSTGWQQANPQNIAAFSALLFAFGRELQKELDAPVGLIAGALGATSSEQWIARRDYEADAGCKEALGKFAAHYSPEAEQKKYEAALAAWEKTAAAAPPVNAQATSAVEVPGKPSPPFRPGDVTRDIKLPGKNIGELYERFIRPLVPYAIRGVLWDQGEGGTGIFGLDQTPLMAALIKSWRKDWRQGDYPFVYVQKPSGGGCAWNPADPLARETADPFQPSLPPRPFAVQAGALREDYLRIMRNPGTVMVSASDLGGGTHPLNKSGYGARACRVALGAVYGRKVEFYGPLYASCAPEGNALRLRFTHVGQGLAMGPGERLQGFQIAGSDRAFAWADARIDGESVVVSSAKVLHPVAARYAWNKYIQWANFFNRDGLPALSFRTDDWEDK